MTKICSKKDCEFAGFSQSLESYYKDKTSSDGYSSICKKCKAAWTKNHRNNDEWRKKRNERRLKNIDKIRKQVSEYTKKHRKHLNECRNKIRNERWKNDPEFRMRCLISSYIKRALKKQFKVKNSSTWKKLSYTPEQLREHLEKQFEPWMNWENHGNFRENERTWHVDHIIPQSKLIYDSMDHPNFQKCWALENLRPLEALENIIKGNKEE